MKYLVERDRTNHIRADLPHQRTMLEQTDPLVLPEGRDGHGTRERNLL